MPDQLAEEIIKMRDAEKAKQQGFWNAVWQDTADLCCPREDQINTKTTPGQDKSTDRYDDTAVMDSKEMAAGLYSALFPVGQLAFGYTAKDKRLDGNDRVTRWLRYATEITHEALFSSNFPNLLPEVLRTGAAAFGTGCLYSEYDYNHGRLNFRELPISTYQIKENTFGQVDCVIHTDKMTARQAVEEYGEEALRDEILKAAGELKDESKKFGFIHIVRPRAGRNPLLRDNQNMPSESIVVDETNKVVVREQGFEENPFHVFRWEKGSNEKYGRAPGTDYLSAIRTAQTMAHDLLELLNRKARPPLAVKQSFQGVPDLTPDAINSVMDVGDIQGLAASATGDIQACAQALDAQQKLIHEFFYRDIFVPITDLQGDRRSATEIQARQREALGRIGGPVGRVYSELLTPLLSRCLHLLIRWGVIVPPPAELVKGNRVNHGTEYLGPLALAMRSGQATAFTSWVGILAPLAAAKPEVLDWVNFDSGVPRLGLTQGVNIGDVNTEEKVMAIRAARAKQQQANMMMQAAQAAGNANKGLSTAPEAGSPAEALMKGVTGA